MSDQHNLNLATTRLLNWLRKWPGQSKGKSVEIYLELDGMWCRLSLEPKHCVTAVREAQLIEATKTIMARLK